MPKIREWDLEHAIPPEQLERIQRSMVTRHLHDELGIFVTFDEVVEIIGAAKGRIERNENIEQSIEDAHARTHMALCASGAQVQDGGSGEAMTRLFVPWFLRGVLVGLLPALAYQIRSERMQANSRPLMLPVGAEYSLIVQILLRVADLLQADVEIMFLKADLAPGRFHQIDLEPERLFRL